jgi:hypothetical protein
MTESKSKDYKSSLLISQEYKRQTWYHWNTYWLCALSCKLTGKSWNQKPANNENTIFLLLTLQNILDWHNLTWVLKTDFFKTRETGFGKTSPGFGYNGDPEQGVKYPEMNDPQTREVLMISKLSLKLMSDSLLVSVSLYAATDDSEDRADLALVLFTKI